MRSSRPGRPLPELVGVFAADVSPYGARDLAGSMRDWGGDASYDGNLKLRPVRGGSWFMNGRNCRSAVHFGMDPWLVSASNGFRLARVAAASSRVKARPSGVG